MHIELEKNTKYHATIELSTIEALASNSVISDKLKAAGFTFVTVSGSGKSRTATGLWPKDTQRAALPSQVKSVKKI